jgi:hypothetical protein
MSLLGIALPNLKGGVQCAIDLFPEPEKSRTRRMGASTFHDFLIVKFGFNLDQKQLWEIFQRVLNVTAAECWNVQLQRDLAELATNKITPPRNHFLYKATFWPFEDLVVDGVPEDFGTLFGNELDVDSPGFLLRLSFSIAILFENLMTDLGTKSAVISEQVQGCRFLSSFEKADVAGYRTFLGQL